MCVIIAQSLLGEKPGGGIRDLSYGKQRSGELCKAQGAEALLDKPNRGSYNVAVRKSTYLKGGSCVTKVVVEQGESFDSLLKRFKKKVQRDRILSEARRRRFFEKPSIIRKRKKAAKLRKSRRQTLKEQQMRY